MTTLGREVLRHLRAGGPTLVEVAPPSWLATARWRPEILVGEQPGTRLLAVDVIPSAGIPWTIYREEVSRLLQAHRDLRVVVCVLEDGFARHPGIERECSQLRIGLKVLLPGLGIETIVKTDLDPSVTAATLPKEEGWFPSAILAAASGLQRVCFAQQIDRFIQDLNATGHDEHAVFDLVRGTIDALLGRHPTVGPNIQQFMRLSHFETLLRLASPGSSEHVFHSFRVFLAGCPIINQFYDVFRFAHERFCLRAAEDLSVEYAWLLASIFHDIGRPKEGVGQLVDDELQDEDLEVTIRGKETRWLRPEWRCARSALASLGAFVGRLPASGNWDGGIVPDARGEDLAAVWTKLYDDLRSHAVIGSMDFLAELFRTAAAADETANRPFVVTHAVPAALAILLHDWRIRQDAKRWGLFPINSSAMPMAALLIYLDTWDDYRRKGPEPLIFVRDYTVNARGASVTVEWADSESLEKEKVKYRAFKSALRAKPFQLKITARMARS